MMSSSTTGRSSTVAGRITRAPGQRRTAREPAPKDRLPDDAVSWVRLLGSAGLAALGLPEDVGDLVDQVDQLLTRLGVDRLGAGGPGGLGGSPEQVVDL